MKPPSKFKIKTSGRFKPNNINQIKNVMDDFLLTQKEFLSILDDSKQICLKQNRSQIPLSSYIDLSIGDTFLLTIAHEQRHLWQIERIKKNIDFPIA